MRRALAILLLTIPAAAATTGLADEIAALDAAVSSRLSAPSPAAEGKSLAKAARALAAYAGDDGAKDRGAAAMALLAVEKSGTSDAAISAAADALLTAIGDLAAARKVDASTRAAVLVWEKDIAAVARTIARGDARVAAASFADGRGARARLLAGAASDYEKAQALAEKLIVKEIRDGASGGGGGGGGGGGTTGSLGMLTGGTYAASGSPWVATTVSGLLDEKKGVLSIRGTQAGANEYALFIGAAGVAGPGTYPLPLGGGHFTLTISGLTLNVWMVQAGSLTVTGFDPATGAASGSFTFTALGLDGTTVTAINGQFSLTGLD